MLKTWIEKLESMQVILTSEDAFEMNSLKRDQFEIDFEKLREDLKSIRDMMK